MAENRLLPALFDLQVNGFAGVDYQDPALSLGALRQSVEALRHHSTHRILLTLITERVEVLCRQLERIEAFRQTDPLIAETIAGYHLEGPWLSGVQGYRGAHRPECMCLPKVADLDALVSASGGRLKLITLAPELPGSASFIQAARGLGILIALGHTEADARAIDDAIRAGATLCTHLGNAVPQLLPRHDNVVQRLLARDELTACFIPDGIHLPPFVLKNLFRAKPADKVILVTDCMAAAGAGPGRYRIAHMEVEVGADRIVREPGKPNFAGSSLTLDAGVANAAAWLGLSFETAWSLASLRAAELFHITLPSIPVAVSRP